MAMGKRDTERQGDLWLATTVLARSPGHPFYERFNALHGVVALITQWVSEFLDSFAGRAVPTR